MLADLPGPKVRLGRIEPDPFAIRAEPAVQPARGRAGPTGTSTTYPQLAEDLREGDRVLLADGAVELTVAAVEDGVVELTCVRGGTVRSGQGRQRARRAAEPARGHRS